MTLKSPPILPILSSTPNRKDSTMKRVICPETACRNGFVRVDETRSKLCDLCGGDGSILTTDERAEKYSKELDRLTVAIIKADLNKMNAPLHVRRQCQDLQMRGYLKEKLNSILERRTNADHDQRKDGNQRRR